MLLCDGITGFSNSRVIPTISRDEFKRICFEISTTLKFKIENFDFKLERKNFYSAKIKVDNDNVFILLNAYYPIISFASKINPFNNIYINHERLNCEFSKVYHVLTVSELESPIGNEEKECLNNEELKQLRYYNPNNLAEIIFNYWD